MMTTKFKFLFASLALAGITTLSAQTVGYVTLSIAAGTGSARTVSVLSFPLADSGQASGQLNGIITGVTAATFTNSSAGWTAGQLSTAATPYLIRITSGTAKGRTFLVSTATANTATTLTIDPEEAALVDLTTVGIAAGTDTYELIPCDTISNVFGTPATTGIQGGTTSATADIVQLLVSGGWRQYYYNTTSSAWLRIGPNSNSNNVAIRPDTAALYQRLPASGLSLIVSGTVPSVDRKALVKNSGTTFLSNGWPVDVTLGTSGINSIPGWLTGTATTADIVQIQISGGWRQYYHNGTQWLRVGPNTASNSVVIPTGAAVILLKKGAASGAVALSQTLPY